MYLNLKEQEAAAVSQIPPELGGDPVPTNNSAPNDPVEEMTTAML